MSVATEEYRVPGSRETTLGDCREDSRDGPESKGRALIEEEALAEASFGIRRAWEARLDIFASSHFAFSVLNRAANSGLRFRLELPGHIRNDTRHGVEVAGNHLVIFHDDCEMILQKAD